MNCSPAFKWAIRRLVVPYVVLASLLAGCGSGTTGNQTVQTPVTSVPASRAGGGSSSTATGTTPSARPIAWQAPGMTYNGLHATTSPTDQTVTNDLSTIKNTGFKTIRTYYPQYTGSIDVDTLARNQGLQVLLGLYIFAENPQWTEDNYQTFVKRAIANGNVVGILVGNEDPADAALILKYLQKIKADFPNVPVSTAQTGSFWLSDPRAAQFLPYCDFIAANIYPDWNWQAPVNLQPAINGVAVTPQAGFATFTGSYDSVVSKYPGRQVVVTETGWPTTYGWVINTTPPPQPQAGIDNANAYLKLVNAWASSKSVNVYVYSMFDDVYAVNTTSQYNFHFGLIDYNGKAKGISF